MSLTAIYIIGERLFLRYLKNYLINDFHIKKHYNLKLEKILLCGAGADCRYFINSQSSKFEDNPNIIIGIIDDDPIFFGQFVYGKKVLGQLSDVNTVFTENSFDKITITKRKEKKNF